MVRHGPLGRRLESWFGFGIKYSSSSILLQGGKVNIKIFFFFYSSPGR